MKDKIKYYAYVAVGALAGVGALLGSKPAYAYTATDFGEQLDALTSSSKSFVDVMIEHWFIAAVALVVISGVITFIVGLARGWFHFGGRRR